MTKAVIVYLSRNRNGKQEVCLGRKLTGHGVGKWNGFGGKVEANESFEEAAVRELFEESGVQVQIGNLRLAAMIDYKEDAGDWQVAVFTAEDHQGEPSISTEMEPIWFETNNVPYSEMWPNDKIWLGKVLSGEKFRATFWHNKDGEIVRYEFTSL